MLNDILSQETKSDKEEQMQVVGILHLMARKRTKSNIVLPFVVS